MELSLAHATPSAPVAFYVPPADLSEFTELSKRRREEVLGTLAVLRELAELIPSVGKMAALSLVAASHAGHGMSPVSLGRKYKKFLEKGWRGLVKGYKGPGTTVKPKAFVQEVKRVAEVNHRSKREAYRQLRERWAAGESIPGYGNWREFYSAKFPDRTIPSAFPRDFYPAGWSLDNLDRYGPSRAARSLFQRGIGGSKAFFPSIIRDTSALRPLEVITFDDFVLDCYCVFPGDAHHRPQIGTVAGLAAMDVGTRRMIHWGLGQSLERTETADDGTTRTVRSGIRGVDVEVFLQTLFATYGLPEYQVTILCERGTASISKELEEKFTHLFGGRVRVERTAMIEHRSVSNGFVERGGTPWSKGMMESAFNGMWNILGSMKGYKGSNERLNAPSGLKDKISVTRMFLGYGRDAEQLPPEVVEQLRLPFPDIEECRRAFALAVALRDSRADHNYRGFDRVTEFIQLEGESPRPFRELALLTQEEQRQVQVIDRSETSLERWDRLARGVSFEPIPAAALAIFLLDHISVKSRGNQVTFSHRKVGYTYIDPTGEVLDDTREGEELHIYLDPNAPEEVQVTAADGAFLGKLVRLGGRRGAVPFLDQAAVKEAREQVGQIVKRQLAEHNERHAELNAQFAADRDHNQQVVAQFKRETAELSELEKIAASRGQTARASAERKQRAAALQQIGEEDAPHLL